MRILIKVTHIISDCNIGGAGTYLLNYAACYDREKIALTVLLPQGAALAPLLRARDIGVEELPLAGDDSGDGASFFPLLGALRRQNPDIVHTHGSFWGRVAGKLLGKTVVFTKHTLNEPRRSAKGLLMNKLDNGFCDVAVGVSKAACRNLWENGIAEKKIKLIYNGTAPLRAVSLSEREALRRELSLEPKDRAIAIVARLEPVKDHAMFLKSARLLLRQVPGARFLIAGGGSLERALRDEARELGILERCSFLGPVTDVWKIYGAADGLALTSRMENMPISICEAMSAHVPVAATAVGGVPELLRDGENGLLSPAGDAEAFAENLVRLCKEPLFAEKLAQKAFEDWQSHYSAALFCGGLDRLYKALHEAAAKRQGKVLD